MWCGVGLRIFFWKMIIIFFFGGGGKKIFRDISFEMKCLTEVNFNISND